MSSYIKRNTFTQLMETAKRSLNQLTCSSIFYAYIQRRQKEKLFRAWLSSAQRNHRNQRIIYRFHVKSHSILQRAAFNQLLSNSWRSKDITTTSIQLYKRNLFKRAFFRWQNRSSRLSTFKRRIRVVLYTLYIKQVALPYYRVVSYFEYGRLSPFQRLLANFQKQAFTESFFRWIQFTNLSTLKEQTVVNLALEHEINTKASRYQELEEEFNEQRKELINMLHK